MTTQIYSVFILFGFLSFFPCCGPVKDQPSEVQADLQGSLRFKQYSLYAQVTPLQEKTRVSVDNSFNLRFWDRSRGPSVGSYGPYLDPSTLGVEVDVRLWMRMKSGDHGSDDVVLSPEKDATGALIPGSYLITNARFTMRGKWEIQVRLKKNGIIVDEVIQYIKI